MMPKKISISVENGCLLVMDKEKDEGILTFNLDYLDYDLIDQVTRIILQFIQAIILEEIPTKREKEG